MLKRIKRPILHTLKHFGVHRQWIDSNWRSERLAILCYHGIALEDEHEWNPDLYMPARALEQRLTILRDGGYRVLSLGEAVRCLYQKNLPMRSVVLTFDDGGYDFYRRAYPLLKKYGFPATVYLSTYYCYRAIPIFPLSCHYILWKARDTFHAEKLQDWGCPADADLRTKPSIERVVRAILTYAQAMGSVERNDIPQQLARRLGLDYELLIAQRVFQVMNPEEVARLASDGVDIQLHTHRHRVPDDRDLFIHEIAENRRCILEMTGTEATHFCYPSGVYDPVFLPWLSEQRVVSGTTCEAGLAAPQDHPLLLPRIVDTGRMSAVEFESALAGISASVWRKGKRHSVRRSP